MADCSNCKSVMVATDFGYRVFQCSCGCFGFRDEQLAPLRQPPSRCPNCQQPLVDQKRKFTKTFNVCPQCFHEDDLPSYLPLGKSV